jgi:uncharacterized membrane protein
MFEGRSTYNGKGRAGALGRTGCPSAHMHELFMQPPNPGLLPASLVLHVVNACLALVAATTAMWLRPWRCVGAAGPPAAWWLALAAVTWLWNSSAVAAQPMSGAALLVLMAGWPLAVIAFCTVAVVSVASGSVDWLQALHRLVWLGLVPATCMLLIGAALRRWLPRHVFVYILGRGFFATLLASFVALGLAPAFNPAPHGLAPDDLLVAGLLRATSEAFLCGHLIAILVVMRPHWLATYSERLYLSP